MKKSEIREILNFMNSLYPNRKIEITTSNINTWYEMLGEYELEDVRNAIKKLANKVRYIPNIPEITDNIVQSSFTIETSKVGNLFIVTVLYPDEKLPFRFSQESRANQFVSFVKQNQDREHIQELYMAQIKQRNDSPITIMRGGRKNENYKRRKTTT